MDDVAREAQDRGYNDGRKGLFCSPGKYGYCGHLKAAYERGHAVGKGDQAH